MEIYEVGKILGFDTFLFDMSAKLRNASLCLSVRPHEVARLPQDGLP
jgi:hypothetical protein